MCLIYDCYQKTLDFISPEDVLAYPKVLLVGAPFSVGCSVRMHCFLFLSSLGSGSIFCQRFLPSLLLQSSTFDIKAMSPKPLFGKLQLHFGVWMQALCFAVWCGFFLMGKLL